MKIRVFFLQVFTLFYCNIYAQQKILEGFYNTPKTVEITAVNNTIFGYGTDFIEYGKMPVKHKFIIWNDDGSIREEIDLTPKFSYNHRNNIYKGQIKDCFLSVDKKSVIVWGQNYQFQGDMYATIIFSYNIEIRKWITIFENKNYTSHKITFHPSNPDIIVLEGYLNPLQNTSDYEWPIYIFDIKQNQMLQKIKTFKYPNIPILTQFSKDGKKLFVSVGTNVENKGFMEIYNTSNYKLLKTIHYPEQIKHIFETPTDFYFCGAYHTLVYQSKNFSLKETLRNYQIKGIYPKLNFAIMTKYDKVTFTQKSHFYHLKTKKFSPWQGSQILQSYHEATNQFIALDFNEFSYYDQNYKMIFNPPALKDLKQPVSCFEFDLSVFVK